MGEREATETHLVKNCTAVDAILPKSLTAGTAFLSQNFFEWVKSVGSCLTPLFKNVLQVITSLSSGTQYRIAPHAYTEVQPYHLSGLWPKSFNSSNMSSIYTDEIQMSGLRKVLITALIEKKHSRLEQPFATNAMGLFALPIFRHTSATPV